MLRSCPYCGRIHEGQCPKKPKRQKSGIREAERFRSTNAWAKKRAEVGERDYYLCRICLEELRITYDGIEAHHIIPLEESMEYALDADWIISLCVKHHKQADRGGVTRERLHKLAMRPVSPLPGAEKQGERCNTTGEVKNGQTFRNGNLGGEGYGETGEIGARQNGGDRRGGSGDSG